MFAKFISEDQIKIAAVTYKDPTCIAFHFNQNVELMKSKGYYEVIETNTREDVTDETHYAVPKYALVQQAHTEAVEKTIVDENNEEQTITENIMVDDSYIECTYVAVEIPAPEEEPVEEVSEEEPQEEVEEEAPEIEGEG